MSGARVIEHWETVPTPSGTVERYDVPDGVGIIYVLQYPRRMVDPTWFDQQFKEIAKELLEHDPKSAVLALPDDCAFRVLHIDE